jgi:long-subunit acyl-CoA synthetase (AMP-forming)
MTPADQGRALEAGDLCQAFARTVARHGDQPALRSSDGATTLSWREFDDRMRAVAGGLADLGVGPGGTVAMVLTNRFEAAVTDMATLHLGAVPVSLYNTSAVGQLAYLFGDSRADVIVTERVFAERVGRALTALAPAPAAAPRLVVVDGDRDSDGDAAGKVEAAGRAAEPALTAEWEAHRPDLAALRAVVGLEAGELLFTGAAPLPPETLRFFAAVGADLCECYGQSETAGIVLCNPADRPRPRTNGLPLPGVEATIAPDGELLVKGPMVMAGYRGKPDLTAAAFDADGWLRTGDIFTTDEAGYYRIIDRKKEIIVTSAGKNVSPVLVENTIAAASPLVGSVACIGDARPWCTALVALEPEATAALTGDTDPARNARHPTVAAALTEAIRRANTELNDAEQIRRFAIVGETWLPGGDELTATMKLKRKPIAAKYAALIDALYGGGEADAVHRP